MATAEKILFTVFLFFLIIPFSILVADAVKEKLGKKVADGVESFGLILLLFVLLLVWWPIP